MRALTLIATVGLVTAVGCKPPKASTTNAIVSADGSDAASLIPMRRHFAKAEKGAAFENSIRLIMMPVKCAPKALAKLEALSALDPELIRHDGNQVVDLNGAKIPGAEDCRIQGNAGLHPWAFNDFFNRLPQTLEEYEQQQWIWLAMRLRYDVKKVSFSAGFDKFLAEGGYYQGVPQGVLQGEIAKWDAVYNPCATLDRTNLLKVKVKKTAYFRCEKGDYVPTSGLLGSRLQDLVAHAAESLLQRIDDGVYKNVETAGLDRAILIDPAQRKKHGDQLGNSAGLNLTQPRTTYGSSYRTYGMYGAQPAGAQYAYYSPYNAGRFVSQPQPVVTQNYANRINGNVVTYPGDNAQYIRQDVTQLMQQQGNSGAGSQYRTELLAGTNGQNYYVDRYANGENRWYTRGPNGDGWNLVGVTGGSSGNAGQPGTIVGQGNIQASQAYAGWNHSDVTQQMQREGYTGFNSSTMYVNAATGQTHYVDQRADGSYQWFTRNQDGTFQPQYGRDAQGNSIGPTQWNDQTGRWEPRPGATGTATAVSSTPTSTTASTTTSATASTTTSTEQRPAGYEGAEGDAYMDYLASQNGTGTAGSTGTSTEQRPAGYEGAEGDAYMEYLASQSNTGTVASTGTSTEQRPAGYEGAEGDAYADYLSYVAANASNTTQNTTQQRPAGYEGAEGDAYMDYLNSVTATPTSTTTSNPNDVHWDDETDEHGNITGYVGGTDGNPGTESGAAQNAELERLQNAEANGQ